MIGTTVAMLFVLAGQASSAPVQKHLPLRTFVYTAQAPGGGVSEEEQGRLDSVKDLADALGKWKIECLLVKSADEADVIVEVLNREERDAPVSGFGGASVTRFRETIVRLRVKSGEKQSELKGMGQASWKSAAKDAAERLAKWIRNR
jgi:hypothetical protein